MAEKISMIIVVVDLDCYKCYNKMRKILCQLQDHERIRTISFDDKSKTITIVGPFDPQRLACKIRCKGGKVVKDVHVVDNPGGKPPPPMLVELPSPPANSGKKKNKDKPPAPPETQAPEPGPPPPAPATPPPASAPTPVNDMPPPSPVHQLPAPGREMAAGMPAFIEDKRPKARTAELEAPMSPPPKDRPMDMPTPVMQPPPPAVNERPSPRPQPCRPLEPPVEYVPPTVEIPSWPAPPVGPCGCPCCAPCYQGYYEGCRCCCCGRVYSNAVSVQPLLPAGGVCGYGYRGCRTFSDDDPSAACSIM